MENIWRKERARYIKRSFVALDQNLEDRKRLSSNFNIFGFAKINPEYTPEEISHGYRGVIKEGIESCLVESYLKPSWKK